MSDVMRRWRIGLAAALLLWSTVPAAANGRVVAVGDVHGDREGFQAILREAGLLDAAGEWIGGDATLVQDGDFLDRGPHCRGMMDLLMELPGKARRAGGRVVVLLGNHEVMNLLGDLRYVTRDNYAEFADARSDKRRAAAWKGFVRQRRARARRLGLPQPALTAADEERWREQHPAGFVEHRQALAADGRYGRWLRGLPAIARIGDVVFVHGGISPALAGRSVEQIRDRVAEELALFDRYRDYLVRENVVDRYARLSEMIAAAREELRLLAPAEGEPAREKTAHESALEEFLASENWYIRHPDGPLWFRGPATWEEQEGTDELRRILGALGASHLVVAHTPTSDRRIQARFGGNALLIDTGMLSSYYEGGRPSALEIADDRFTAVYLGETARLIPPEPGAGPPSEPVRQEFEEPAGADGGRAHGPRGAPAAAGPQAGEEAPAPEPAPPPSGPRRGPRRFLDPESRPLPFASDEEVLEFLRTARVVSQKIIKAGINQPSKVLLEKDGVQMHAVFRDVDVQEDVVFFQGRREMFFRDSYYFEPAAYELARMLGLDNVPPVLLRKLGRDHGSLQVWIEEAMTEGSRQEKDLQPPDVVEWNRRMQQVRIFDALIFNTDRNQGNILIDGDWNLWMIDHTRAFRHHKRLPDTPGFAQCDRELYRRLKELDPEEVRTRLKPFLRKQEIEGLLRRRDKLIAYIDKLVRDLGEDAVFFDFEPVR